MALRGIKVLELAGLAPAPFCGMILSDFGANVIRIDKFPAGPDLDVLSRGKRSISVNLKKSQGRDLVKKLALSSDVLIEPYRKGVMEKLGLGPNDLLTENPKLVYARLTGFGQNGPLADRAGHDINYLAISGMLSYLGRANEKPLFPINLLADFAGGGLMCAFGIVMALLEREKSSRGQVVDTAMTEGAAYLGSFLTSSRKSFIWNQPYKRGTNMLDGGAHFYDTYETKDGRYMAVGAIEPQFYDELLKGLGVDESDAPHMSNFAENKKLFTNIFKTKTLAEWTKIFENTDACVTPILDSQEAALLKHNIDRKTYMKTENGYDPSPAPKLSRTPASNEARLKPQIGQHTLEILKEYNLSNQDIDNLIKNKIVNNNTESKL
ncbi:DgyrCDS9771 [Dimorphilus gyrociliatus]|uniref:DgyrCDS9771 n=1 Tax=Dimorphilus gyrociliatus TaxID=2664684 RepID=A0A7I8W0P0_9ANNE|nr:DgyrCDS9771 [Dimorphilus gyrociliatus]